MGFFGNPFGGSNNAKVQEMINNGAEVIDVRTPMEFMGGSVAGSKNIPLNLISNKVDEIKAMNKPVVLCCASGNRSGQATAYLKQHGVDCENGGGWTQVNAMMANRKTA